LSFKLQTSFIGRKQTMTPFTLKEHILGGITIKWANDDEGFKDYGLFF
jgi:hypothetical protein